MTTNVDDRHGSISYQGRWTSPSGDDRFYGGTVSATTNNGATATFRFRGTRVKLYLVVPIGNSGSVKIRATLDNRSPGDHERHAHSYTVYNDVWYDAWDLPNTEHTLVITNAGAEGGNAMQVDRFEIDGSPVTPQQQPASTPTPTPTPPLPPTTTHIIGVVTSTVFQTNTLVISQPSSSESSPSSGSGSTSSPTSRTLSSSSATASPQSQQISGDRTVTSIQIITAAPNGSVQTIISTPDQQEKLSDSSDEVPLGAIIGGVIGALVFLVLAGILAYLLIKRRRKQRIALGPDTERLTRQVGAVSPFPTDRNSSDDSPPNSATVLRKPSNGTTGTDASRLRPVYPAFNGDEKHRNPFTNNSPGASNDNYECYDSPTSESTRDIVYSPVITTGGGNLQQGRPHYLSGETVRPPLSPSIYSQAEHATGLLGGSLRSEESRDVPPSYQSVSNRTSGLRQSESALDSAHLSYMSPMYSGPRHNFELGSQSESQAH